MNEQSTLTMGYRLGVPVIRMANTAARRTGEELAEFQERVRRLDARLAALWLHYQDTSNIYFALEALSISIEQQVNPPGWVLQVLRPGIAAHLEHAGKSGESDLGVCLGVRLSGSGCARPSEQYRDREKFDAAMREMWKLCAGGASLAAAARDVRGRFSLSEDSETLERKYREDWRPFYSDLLGVQEKKARKSPD